MTSFTTGRAAAVDLPGSPADGPEGRRLRHDASDFFFPLADLADLAEGLDFRGAGAAVGGWTVFVLAGLDAFFDGAPFLALAPAPALPK